jgi:hypothetical protein
MTASPSKAGLEAQGSGDDKRRRSNVITNIFVE